MKHYVVLNDGRIGYISNICTCESCRERGSTEIFVNDLYDNYLDCIEYHESFSSIQNVGKSIKELSQSHSAEQIARFIADVYQDELLRKSVVT